MVSVYVRNIADLFAPTYFGDDNISKVSVKKTLLLARLRVQIPE
jgi:hypothetical protein